MFHKPEVEQNLDLEINRILSQMKDLEVDSDEYKIWMDNLKVLYELKGVKSQSSISADTLVNAIVNVVGILLVINHERINVITTKAITMAFRKAT